MATTQNQQPQFKYQRRRQSVQFFVEPLRDDLDIEMMLIPAGIFMMGSPEDELDRLSSESPQHEVSVPSFFMSKYPVTQAQWRFVAELPQVSRKLKPDPSGFKGDKRPVESVSWYEAVEFCVRLSRFVESRLSAHIGREYRLPTEAEWEYACRAETTTPFHFGETITTDLANYRGTDYKELKWSGSYRQGPKGEYRGKTTPVDHFRTANAFGLCNMHGNVLEWCQDHWHRVYEGAPTDGSVWLTDNEGARRVRRGGSWDSYPGDCRSACRVSDSPYSWSNTVSFRVVCSNNSNNKVRKRLLSLSHDTQIILEVKSYQPQELNELPISVTIRSVHQQISLPPNIKVLILDQSAEVVMTASSNSNDTSARLEFTVETDEEFSVIVTLGETSIKETFTGRIFS